jgi:predicted MPP superfamily phosphohydrolase
VQRKRSGQTDQVRWRRLGVSAGAFAVRWTLRIGLPIAGVAAALALFPIHVQAAGVQFQVQGSLLHENTLSADTTFGSWIFPDVDALPVGAHVRPVDVDLVRLAQAVKADPSGFARQLRHDLVAALPGVAAWLGLEILAGLTVGLLLAAAISLARRQLRGLPPRRHEIRRRAYAVLATGAVLTLIAGVGRATYQPDWTHDSRLSGTLATLQLFPNDLSAYYQKHSKAIDALNAVAVIQSQLQHRVDARDVPATAYNVMFISDMHLAASYPLVKQYAANFHVRLIVNTGDEAEFGTRAEMTPTYLDQLRAVTRKVPMLWLPGNHDSPATVRIMRRIHGVTVLGTKTSNGRGGTDVTGGMLTAFGLDVGAVPDPRVYGGRGAYGADDSSVVDPLERKAIDSALNGLPTTQNFDLFLTHEPVAAQEALQDMPGRIRETAAGHVHHQNPEDQLQSGDGPITLVEGSTGAGGLDNLATHVAAPPLEFSVESVSAGCQFTKIVRFQITGSAPTSPGAVGNGSALPQVTASTHYFTPQPLAKDRQCSTSLGISQPSGLPPSGP